MPPTLLVEYPAVAVAMEAARASSHFTLISISARSRHGTITRRSRRTAQTRHLLASTRHRMLQLLYSSKSRSSSSKDGKWSFIWISGRGFIPIEGKTGSCYWIAVDTNNSGPSLPLRNPVLAHRIGRRHSPLARKESGQRVRLGFYRPASVVIYIASVHRILALLADYGSTPFPRCRKPF